MEQGDFRGDRDETGDGPERAPGKVDRAIALAAPLLDLVLAVGERVSRIAEPVDYEHYPVRPEASDGDRERESGKRPGDDRR
jgi:hypothetical protein